LENYNKFKICRLIFSHNWTGNSKKAIETLKQLSDYFRVNLRGYKITYFHTCGGFLILDLNNFSENWHETVKIIKSLSGIKKVINNFASISDYCKYASFGIDIYDTKSDYHLESVVLLETARSEIIAITGKSHPTQYQKRWLIKAPLESHFVKNKFDKLLILGCHDLNMFSPRAIANVKMGSDSFERLKKMNCLVDNFKPTTILQHPHTTDSIKIWNISWNYLRSKFYNISYSGAGKYYNPDGKQRSELYKIVFSDCSKDVLTIVRRSNGRLKCYGSKIE